jgi:hypothetical protein
MNMKSRRGAAAALAVALGFPLSGTTSFAQNNFFCDASGNEAVLPEYSPRCLDRSNGLWVTYYLFGPISLYNSSGTLVKSFGFQTVQNTDWQTTCGPADAPNAIGYANDGSGQYVNVTNYHRWPDTDGNYYIYNADGTVSDTFKDNPSGPCPGH